MADWFDCLVEILLNFEGNWWWNFAVNGKNSRENVHLPVNNGEFQEKSENGRNFARENFTW